MNDVLIYNDKKSNFNELLVKYGSVSIQHQNSQKLAVGMIKVSRDLSTKIVNELFQFREQIRYELRQRPQFQIPWVHSVFSGTESLKFPGRKIWPLVSNIMKQRIYGNLEMQQNDGNLHPVLADYAKDIFIGLGFFNKKLF